MKNVIKVAVLSCAFSACAYADLSGDYLSSWWTIAENGGSIGIADNAVGAPGTISLVSNNSGGLGRNQDITITAPADMTFSFDWSFATSDSGIGFLAGPFWDPFGYLHNGTFHRLSDNFGPATQTGSISFEVLDGEIFGLRAQSIDGSGGAATSIASNLSAFAVSPATIVPLPPAVWLMAAALSALFMAERRHLDPRAA